MQADRVEQKTGSRPTREYSLFELLKRPQLRFADIQEIAGSSAKVPKDVAEQVEIDAKYAGYVERQQEDVDKLHRQENTIIPQDFDYSEVKGLSNEVRQKLADARPQTLARASRIPGITPAAISLLLIYLKKNHLKKSTTSQKTA